MTYKQETNPWCEQKKGGGAMLQKYKWEVDTECLQ